MGISIRYEEATPGVKIKYEQKYIFIPLSERLWPWLFSSVC